MFIQSIPVPAAIEPLLDDLQRKSANRYHGYDRIYRVQDTSREYVVGTEYDQDLKQYWPSSGVRA